MYSLLYALAYTFLLSLARYTFHDYVYYHVMITDCYPFPQPSFSLGGPYAWSIYVNNRCKYCLFHHSTSRILRRPRAVIIIYKEDIYFQRVSLDDKTCLHTWWSCLSTVAEALATGLRYSWYASWTPKDSSSYYEKMQIFWGDNGKALAAEDRKSAA